MEREREGERKRECQGDVFSLLPYQVWYGWRKVYLVFMKHNDPELPFYYHTSTHTRFYGTEMPDFNYMRTWTLVYMEF